MHQYGNHANVNQVYRELPTGSCSTDDRYRGDDQPKHIIRCKENNDRGRILTRAIWVFIKCSDGKGREGNAQESDKALKGKIERFMPCRIQLLS
jgi:hypothetical protein